VDPDPGEVGQEMTNGRSRGSGVQFRLARVGHVLAAWFHGAVAFRFVLLEPVAPLWVIHGGSDV